MSESRWGLTIPLEGVSLEEHARVVRALPDFGYTDVWSAETNHFDAFTPLVLTAMWEPTLRLGTAIVPVFTRGPAVIAMSAAALATVAPGRFVLGLGSSSPVIVGDWNGINFEKPYQRNRDVLRAVKRALAGERIDEAFETFALKRLKIAQPVPDLPIALAALRPQMLRLAGKEADGVIMNWLSASDVPQCLEATGNPGIESIARIFVCPTDDVEYARAAGRRLVAGYLTVPAYAAFQDWLGRGDKLEAMQAAWAAGDREGALAEVPDDVVDELVLHGSPESCREQVQAYVDAGLRTPVLSVTPTPAGPPDLAMVEALGRH